MLRALRALNVRGVDVGAVLFDVGRRVAELRATRGITQEKLAEASGIDVKDVQKIEGGKLNVTVRTLVALASALELQSVGELFAEPTSREVRKGRPKRREGSS